MMIVVLLLNYVSNNWTTVRRSLINELLDTYHLSCFLMVLLKTMIGQQPEQS